MRYRRNVLCGLLAAAICCTPVLGGCSSKDASSSAQKEAGEETQAIMDEEDEDDDAGEGAVNLGEFSMEDIDGNTYTQEMFAEYDLTMINVFATWCTPCVNEIPDLEKLHKEMEGKGVGVFGIVLDVGSGSEKIEKAKLLAEKTGATYPFLIPDESYMNGRLAGIEAVPETFFVDREGNIVGKTYSGSGSFEEWKYIVEKELEEVAK